MNRIEKLEELIRTVFNSDINTDADYVLDSLEYIFPKRVEKVSQEELEVALCDMLAEFSEGAEIDERN